MILYWKCSVTSTTLQPSENEVFTVQRPGSWSFGCFVFVHHALSTEHISDNTENRNQKILRIVKANGWDKQTSSGFIFEVEDETEDVVVYYNGEPDIPRDAQLSTEPSIPISQLVNEIAGLKQKFSELDGVRTESEEGQPSWNGSYL